MRDGRRQTACGQINSATRFAIVINVSLFIVKVSVGLFSGSFALVADGIHSLSDMITDVAVLFGIYISRKEPDRNHPYGHGRAETFSAGFIAIILFFTGSVMIYYAAVDIAKGNVPTLGVSVLIVAAISVVVKEALYRFTKKIAIKFQSVALYANAWHQRSDAISSVAVLIGFISLKFGFKFGDQIAAIAVGLMIILVASRIIGQCLIELMEGAVDENTIEEIKRIVNLNSSIRQWHKLRTRMVGREIFLDLHILVAPELNITAAHEISENLENSMREHISRPINITVHIEPDLSNLRI